jgi:hypothetical protein
MSTQAVSGQNGLVTTQQYDNFHNNVIMGVGPPARVFWATVLPAFGLPAPAVTAVMAAGEVFNTNVWVPLLDDVSRNGIEPIVTGKPPVRS